jgi:general secretion pathway protein I
VLISGAGMALFSWVNSSIMALRRVEDTNKRNEAIANVVEYMQAINPMATPEGEANFGGYQIRWKSQAVTPTADNTNYPQGIGLYRVGLFETHISAMKSDDPRWFELKLLLVGHKKVREIQGLY